MKLENIIQEVFDVKPNEKILIVTDKKKLKIAKKIYSACRKLSKNVKIILKPVGKRSGEEPPRRIAEEMKKADIVLAPTLHSITHTKARINACKHGARIATMPGITEKMFHQSLLADPKELERYGKRLVKALKNKSFVRISTKRGTGLFFLITKRKIEPDTANIRKKGEYGNLPAGEVSLSPVENTANGILVIDSMEEYAKSGTKVLILNGLAVDISDKGCKLAKIFNTVKNSRNVAEFGIGMNKKAKIIVDILQNEKVFGTCHIAFGNNKSYNGKVYCQFHEDAILKKPTIEVDGEIIIKKGVWKI
jgi:leucyl aminopeptidase (aminopeptidase T)